jgi:hypothetical protein
LFLYSLVVDQTVRYEAENASESAARLLDISTFYINETVDAIYHHILHKLKSKALKHSGGFQTVMQVDAHKPERGLTDYERQELRNANFVCILGAYMRKKMHPNDFTGTLADHMSEIDRERLIVLRDGNKARAPKKHPKSGDGASAAPAPTEPVPTTGVQPTVASARTKRDTSSGVQPKAATARTERAHTSGLGAMPAPARTQQAPPSGVGATVASTRTGKAPARPDSRKRAASCDLTAPPVVTRSSALLNSFNDTVVSPYDRIDVDNRFDFVKLLHRLLRAEVPRRGEQLTLKDVAYQLFCTRPLTNNPPPREVYYFRIYYTQFMHDPTTTLDHVKRILWMDGELPADQGMIGVYGVNISMLTSTGENFVSEEPWMRVFAGEIQSTEVITEGDAWDVLVTVKFPAGFTPSTVVCSYLQCVLLRQATSWEAGVHTRRAKLVGPPPKLSDEAESDVLMQPFKHSNMKFTVRKRSQFRESSLFPHQRHLMQHQVEYMESMGK